MFPSVNPLHAIKLLHTLAWVFFASCIVAVPFMAWRGWFAEAFLLNGIVSIEALVIIINGWRCPLTDMAERYTTDRRDNFDIYLPLWLARHNKSIFGPLYVAGMVYTVSRWQGWL